MNRSKSTDKSPAFFSDDGKRYILRDPLLARTADAFLFNDRMLFQATCAGYATAQFMQPEAAAYAHGPFLTATTFMQPEPMYYAHHPGRFFYVRDNESGGSFSAPYEPVRGRLDRFEFAPGLSDIRWVAAKNGIEVKLTVTVPRDDVVELWNVTVANKSRRNRRISIYPYFPAGYMSWMNMAGEYHEKLRGIICSCVTGYQLLADYFRNKDLKDLTYLLADVRPSSWQANQKQFEGVGGLSRPDGLSRPRLARGDARFELPAGILQFSRVLGPGRCTRINLAFGPAKDLAEIRRIKRKYVDKNIIERVAGKVERYNAGNSGCIEIETPDKDFDNFVNHWLGRQINYLGRTNRMTTDPQSRNYLQDAMGMVFIDAVQARDMLRKALSQQRPGGAMPDGILLIDDTQLKYINRVPHRDHCVWAVLAVAAYVNETGDIAFLTKDVPFADGADSASVYEHICRGLDWLVKDRSKRGLSLIGQGDWCDPMNMAGYRGKGESGWQSEAMAYALKCWAPFCEALADKKHAAGYRSSARSINSSLNRYMWDGSWYARGTTDEGIRFGVKKDKQGKIFLNAQSWAILCGAAKDERLAKCIAAVEKELQSPRGPMTLAPAYSKMREDVGRLTQKHPGVGENGSAYCHAGMFYIFALYSIGRSDHAFGILRSLLVGPDIGSIRRTKQLPIYLPTYYRGTTFPRTAGRSSHLPNTGTPSWYYRCAIEMLFGLRGEPDGLRVEPQLPSGWKKARVRRLFRGTTFDVQIRRTRKASKMLLFLDGNQLEDNLIRLPFRKHHTVEVLLPG